MSDVVVGRTETPEALAHHAARCGTTPARLRRALRGDLDTIVAKALKKNAAERYASVTALADDLRRFLRHEPISARPDTLRYRATRFVRRHARAVAAAAVAVLVLGGLTAFYTNRLATERDRAQREAAKAAKVSEALTGLLIGADPIANRATPDGLTVRGLLDAAAERVQKELADQPEAQAEIFTVIGRMYRRLGMYDKAQQLLEQALISGRAAFGPEHAERGADAQRSRRPGGREGRLPSGGGEPRVGAEHAPHNLRPGAHGRRRHAGRARPHLPGSGTQRACRAAAPRSAGDQAEGARRRTRRNRRQLERPGVGAAAERRPRRRRGAASAIARGAIARLAARLTR